MMKPLQIFRAGTHTDMSGRSLSFSTSDLSATAAAYHPALHEAPLVVGHPATDDPAHGWVERLVFQEGALEAIPHQVNPDFAVMVNAGRFKNISASFWLPDSPGNPVPGVYYLRHVGFLGAAAPAVKGLRKPQFAANEVGVVRFEDHYMLTNHFPDPALVDRYAHSLQGMAFADGRYLSFAEALTESRSRLTAALVQQQPAPDPAEEETALVERFAKVLQSIAQKNGQPMSFDQALAEARKKLKGRIKGRIQEVSNA